MRDKAYRLLKDQPRKPEGVDGGKSAPTRSILMPASDLFTCGPQLQIASSQLVGPVVGAVLRKLTVFPANHEKSTLTCFQRGLSWSTNWLWIVGHRPTRAAPSRPVRAPPRRNSRWSFARRAHPRPLQCGRSVAIRRMCHQHVFASSIFPKLAARPRMACHTPSPGSRVPPIPYPTAGKPGALLRGCRFLAQQLLAQRGSPRPVVAGGLSRYQIMFRKSVSGIASRPSGISESSLVRIFGLPFSTAMSLRAMTCSIGPEARSCRRVGVSSTMRPLTRAAVLQLDFRGARSHCRRLRSDR